MRVEQTPLKDCYIIHDTVFADERGYFFESFNQQKFQSLTGLDVSFVQDNQSKSSKGVLRGMHYQLGKHSQAKLVRVLDGAVLDIAVDLRKESSTFGQSFSIELSAENHKQLFVPRGFAHGFVVLSETATFFYKCDNLYNKESEGGFIYNDTTININWQLDSESLVLSEKDKELPSFEDIKNTLIF
jgi:dTDP-4-dehydrorhamnose 3,5-epimerase